MSKLTKQGDPESFDANWRNRKETHYNHFTLCKPKNQIQLAFRSHFEVFQQILQESPPAGRKVIETGCGRGSLSSYFASHGWDVTLLDYNQNVIDVAKSIFDEQNLAADFVVGDALNLQFEDKSFDLITNVGLLEHFEDIDKLMSEQMRVLKPGGWCLSYVVPESKVNIQRYFNWLNHILRFLSFSFLRKTEGKPEVYRSDLGSERYLECVKKELVQQKYAVGMYPLPMISHSPEFPFSLLPQGMESALTRLFEVVLSFRSKIYGRHGWLCDEKLGQAFLVAFQKK